MKKETTEPISNVRIYIGEAYMAKLQALTDKIAAKSAVPPSVHDVLRMLIDKATKA